MNKQITLEQAVEKVHDGMTIMFGGFLGVGSATQIIDAIVAKGVKDLTIIANDTAYDEVAHGKLVSNHQVKKAIVSLAMIVRSLTPFATIASMICVALPTPRKPPNMIVMPS